MKRTAVLYTPGPEPMMARRTAALRNRRRRGGRADGASGSGRLAVRAAALAAPALPSLPDGDHGHYERGDGVEPPEPKERVSEQADLPSDAYECSFRHPASTERGLARLEELPAPPRGKAHSPCVRRCLHEAEFALGLLESAPPRLLLDRNVVDVLMKQV